MLFNEYFLLCQKNGSDFEKIKSLMLKNKWINPMHTNIPGPDGSLGYGGACFPKDVDAILKDIDHPILSFVNSYNKQWRNT